MAKKKVEDEDYIDAFHQILMDAMGSYFGEEPSEKIKKVFEEDLKLSSLVIDAKLNDYLVPMLYDSHFGGAELYDEASENVYIASEYETKRIFKLALIVNELWPQIINEAKYIAAGNEYVENIYDLELYITELVQDSKFYLEAPETDPLLVN